MKLDVSAEIAGLLARGFLRLTENRCVSPDSGADSEVENPLDLSRQPSGHVDHEPPEGRPRWT